MKQNLFTIAVFLTIFSINAQTNPAITSWLQNTTGIMGRHYIDGNSTAINDAVAANVQSVYYNTTWFWYCFTSYLNLLS